MLTITIMIWFYFVRDERKLFFSHSSFQSVIAVMELNIDLAHSDMKLNYDQGPFLWKLSSRMERFCSVVITVIMLNDNKYHDLDAFFASQIIWLLFKMTAVSL